MFSIRNKDLLNTLKRLVFGNLTTYGIDFLSQFKCLEAKPRFDKATQLNIVVICIAYRRVTLAYCHRKLLDY